MGQILLPENIPSIVKASTTQLTLAATHQGQPTRIDIGGQQYTLSSVLTLTTSGTGANGLDTGSLGAIQLWYVYAIANQSSFAVALIASQTAPSTGPTMPSGYGTAYKLVGAFYTDGASTVGSVVAGALGGTVSTEWMSFTPAYGGSPPTFSTNGGSFRRVGDVVQVHFKSVPNANGSGSINPSPLTNLAIDVAKLVPTVNGEGTGLGVCHNNKGVPYDISYRTQTSLFVIDSWASSTTWGTSILNGDTISGSYYYPVSGWKATLL